MSLRSLGVDYVDLYLMHWPCPMNPEGMALLLFSKIFAEARQNRKRSQIPQTRRRLPRSGQDLVAHTDMVGDGEAHEDWKGQSYRRRELQHSLS